MPLALNPISPNTFSGQAAARTLRRAFWQKADANYSYVVFLQGLGVSVACGLGISVQGFGFQCLDFWVLSLRALGLKFGVYLKDQVTWLVGGNGVVLGGSWGLISTALSTANGAISYCKYSYLIFMTLVTKSHEPSSKQPSWRCPICSLPIEA